MVRRRHQLVLVVGLFAALLGAALFGARLTIDQLLHRDAVASAHSWSQFLAQQLRDLDQIIAGAEPTAETRAILEQMRHIGRVHRYRIIGPDGRVALQSVELAAETGRPAPDRTAPAAILSSSNTFAKPLSRPTPQPLHLAEAKVPVVVNGQTVASIEAFVDQTEKREQYRVLFGYAALSIGLFTAIAFGLPAGAWYRRTQEKLRAEERLLFLSRHELMTQLPNRKYLVETLQLALAALPINGTAFALHCVNLDRIKDLNNAFGREVGDAVIRKAAERLRSIARHGDMVANLGGDNFAVLQSGVTKTEAAEALAQRMRTELGHPFLVKGNLVSVSASVGVALAPAHGREAMRIMKCAELALDRAKSSGRNCVRLFTPDLELKLEKRVATEQALRDALATEGFELYFQPIFQVSNSRLSAFEALLRLPVKGGRQLSPSHFIPIAEEMGLIDAIGRWTMRNACRIATMWPPHLTVSVNLSPAQFVGGNAADTVEEALAETGLAPNRLAVEVTENMLLSDADSVLSQLARLKRLGVRVVMDDFGTGYSSLRYLWRFPFDGLKVDQSFVRALGSRERNVEKIITTIIGLGRSLHVTVTAEGVETEGQLGFLRAVGCDHAQGFLVGRPMPQQDLAAAILGDYWRSLPVEAPVPDLTDVAERPRTAAEIN